MRLIDADAFKKVLSEHEMEHDKRRSFDDYDCGAANAYEHASDLLDDMQTVERPHGEWIRHIDDLYPVESTEECSICHEEQRITGNDDNFCPNCGAKMKEGDEK